jgi:hypothetical protein
MGINPLKLLKTAASVVGSAVGLDIEAAIDTLQAENDPATQAMLADLDVRLRELSVEELKTEINAKVDLMKTEIQSEDAYVRRARPTGLYIFYGVTLVQIVVVSLVILLEKQIDYLGLTAAFGSITGPLAGYSAWYTHNRSQDKKNGA